MSRITAFLFVLVIAFTAQADIYRWVDKNGNQHFSDKAGKGAKIKLLPSQRYTPPKSPKHSLATPRPALEKLQSPYRAFTIVSPKKNETLRNNQGLVDINVDLRPELLNGDRLIVVLDGVAVGVPHTAMSFSLFNVDRGSHTLSLRVVNKAGKTVEETDTVSFHLHRAHLGMLSHSII